MKIKAFSLLATSMAIFMLALSCSTPTTNIEKNDKKISNKNNVIAQSSVTPSTSAKDISSPSVSMPSTINTNTPLNDNNKVIEKVTVVQPTNKSFINQSSIEKNSRNFNINLLPINQITNISGNTGGASKKSSIVVDTTGVPHVVFEGKNKTDIFLDDFYSYFDNATSAWAPMQNISVVGTASKIMPLNPCIAVDSGGTKHVVFSWGKGIYYLQGWTGGWTTVPIKVAITTMTGATPKIAIGGSMLHVAFNSDNDIYYATSSDGGNTWKTPVTASYSPGTNSINPSLAVEGRDIPYLVWEEVESNKHTIYYNRQINGAWVKPYMIPQFSVRSSYSPSISLDGTGIPSIAWEMDNGGLKDVFYVKSTNREVTSAWGTPINISNSNTHVPSSISMSPKIASDVYGYSYITWEEFSEGIYYSAQTNTTTNTWSAPIKISQATVGKRAENPAIASDMASNSVHITWESNDTNPLFDVFHTKRTFSNIPNVVNRTATVTTNKGVFQFTVFEDKMPITSANFINLANSGFYNGLSYHRLVSGFVIQGGDPTGTGSGGSGTNIPLEINPTINYNVAGIVAMARTSAPDSASSQYFVTLAPTPTLYGSYAAFGQITSGMSVVNSLVQGDIMTSIVVN